MLTLAVGDSFSGFVQENVGSAAEVGSKEKE